MSFVVLTDFNLPTADSPGSSIQSIERGDSGTVQSYKADIGQFNQRIGSLCRPYRYRNIPKTMNTFLRRITSKPPTRVMVAKPQRSKIAIEGARFSEGSYSLAE